MLSKRLRISLSALASVLLIVLFFVLAFSNLPQWLPAMMRGNRIPVVAVLVLLLLAAFSAKREAAVILGLAVTLVFVALKLSSLWQSALSNGTVIGGLLPWSDSGGYYRGAQLLLAGINPDVWSGRRPWFVGLLASLLGVTGNNLRWTLALLTLITTIACLLLAIEVRASHGTLAGVTTLSLLLLFYDRFIGTALTENMGLALGALGLALLWRASLRDLPGKDWALGLISIIVALLARAGAFLILPLILLWIIWWHRDSPRTKWKLAGLSLAMIAAAILFDTILRGVLVPGAGAFGNFSYTLYGVVTGNQGWSHVFVDHPELAGMGEVEGFKLVYKLAWDSVLSNPGLAISGALETWRDFFLSPDHGAFSFVNAGTALSICLFALGAAGLLACWRYRQTAPASLLLALTIGMLLSVPFVPPIDTGTMRAYAATIPVVAVLLAMGSWKIVALLKVRWLSDPPEQAPVQLPLSSFSVVCLGFCIATPLALGILVRPFSYPAPICGPGERAVSFSLPPGSSIQLVQQDEASSKIPEVLLQDFRRNFQIEVHDSSYPYLEQELKKLQAGQQVWFVIDRTAQQYGDPIWVITPKGQAVKPGRADACLVISPTEPLQPYHIYYAQNIENVTVVQP